MSLRGICNACGLCCFTADLKAKCANLELFTAVGMPWATRCKVYSERWDGMPIRMLDKHGVELEPGQHYCAKDSINEELAIIEKGIGKGCSLKYI